jgi:hypothetical protein
MITIEENEFGFHALEVGSFTVILSSHKSLCERMARILSSCRNMPYRTAIKTIIEDIGFDEEYAKKVYHALCETSNMPTTVQ